MKRLLALSLALVPLVVHTQSTPTSAELAKRTNDLVKGEGETFGFPELLPDTTIALAGLGSKFSTTYYVTKTVHRYDTSGYRTRFSIERPVA